MAQKLSDEILSKIWAKVYKKIPDDRVSLCGSEFETDAKGRTFCTIPGHTVDYIRDAYPQYEVGKEFMLDAEARKPGRPPKEEERE